MLRQPSNLTQTVLRAAIVAVALLPTAIIGTRIGLFDYKLGLLLFLVAAVFSILVISVSAFATRRQSSDTDRRRLSMAAVIAVGPLGVVALAISQGAQSPRIHDISTDLQSPPLFKAAADRRALEDNPLAINPEILAKQAEHYPELTGHSSPLPVAEALLVAAKTAESLNWKIYFIDENAISSQFEAVESSFWFGFKDDIAVRVNAVNGGSRVDLRSASRVGVGDQGVNARRIKEFLQQFVELEAKVLENKAESPAS